MALKRSRRVRKKRTKHSLLTTPLSQPVTFASAPRNPIPKQEIPPLEIERVPLPGQSMRTKPTVLGSVALQTLPLQPIDLQSFARVPIEKQQVALPPLRSYAEQLYGYEPTFDTIGSMYSLRSSKLKPLDALLHQHASQRLGLSQGLFSSREVPGLYDAPPASMVRMQPCALQSQQADLRSISVGQHPVVTRAARFASGEDDL